MSITNKLKVEIFPGLYQQLHIAGTMSIGRTEDNSITLADHSVSGHHATVGCENGRVWIQDEGSTNGTLVNGVPIGEKVFIENEDCISVGYVNLFFLQETTTPPQLEINLDEDQSEEIVIKDLASKSDIRFYLTVTPDNVGRLCETIEAKIATTFSSVALQQEMARALSRLFKPLLNEQEHRIECRLKVTRGKFCFTIKDTSGGGCSSHLWDSILPQTKDCYEEETNSLKISLLQRGVDSIEYDVKENSLSLLKNLHSDDSLLRLSPKKMQKIRCYFGWSQPTTMNDEKSVPLDVAISKSAMNNLRPLPATKFSERGVQGASMIKITPIFPGCICSPTNIHLNIDKEQVQGQFWITPVQPTINPVGFIQLAQNEQIIYRFPVHYTVHKSKWRRWLNLSWQLVVGGALLSLFTPDLATGHSSLTNFVATISELGGFFAIGVSLGLVSLLLSLQQYHRFKSVSLRFQQEMIEIHEEK